MLTQMAKAAFRYILGLFLAAGCWIGGAQLGKFLFPGSDIMILTAVIGLFIGIGLCITTWTNNWHMWKNN